MECSIGGWAGFSAKLRGGDDVCTMWSLFYKFDSPASFREPVVQVSLSLKGFSKMRDDRITYYCCHFRIHSFRFGSDVCSATQTVRVLQEQVVGFHVAGPNAGEITQGWTVGMKLGATKEDFNNSIGIHPTCAEVRIFFDERGEWCGLLFLTHQWNALLHVV